MFVKQVLVAVVSLIFLFVITAILVYIHTINKGKAFGFHRYSIIFFLILTLLSCWLGVLIGAFQLGLLSALDGFIGSSFTVIATFANPFALQNLEKLNVVPYATMLFTIGIAVLGFASQRRLERYNPYTLREYYNIALFLCILLGLMSAMFYFQVVKLTALTYSFLFLLCVMCISQSAYYYLFHNPHQIEQTMARIMRKRIIRAAEKIKPIQNIDYDNVDCYEVIFDDLILWHRTLAPLERSVDVFRQASHHLRAIELVLNDKTLLSYFEYMDYLLPFAIGYFSLYPSQEIYPAKDDRLHRAYYRTLLELCTEDFMKKHILIKQNFIAGLFFARFQMCFDSFYNRNRHTSKKERFLDQWITDASDVLGKRWYSNSEAWCNRNFWRAVYFHSASFLDDLQLTKAIRELCLTEPKADFQLDEKMFAAFHRIAAYKLPLNPKTNKNDSLIISEIRNHLNQSASSSGIGGAEYNA